MSLDTAHSEDNKNKIEAGIGQKFTEKYTKIFQDHGFDIGIRDGRAFIEGNNLKLTGDSVNVFWTGEGVLCQKDYNFFSSDNYIMIDIGVNIGITSLALARQDNIKKIYGYEPFAPTYHQALNNLKQNPELSKKVEVFNYGLGDDNKKLKINYNANLNGSMSSVQNRFAEVDCVENIEIKKASEIISPIIESHKHKKKIFIKMDCEGAEGEILRSLLEANILKEIDVIIMEWHFHEPSNLINILKNNSFIIFNEDVVLHELGMIRAVNSRPN